MSLFLAKLTLTPLIVYLASAAGRRWGPGVSGWLTGLPLLVGPVSVFVCLEQGPQFAAQAAGATLLGMISSCAFCVAYCAASRHGWIAASSCAVGAFGLSTLALRGIVLTPWAAFAAVYATAALSLRLVSAPTGRGTAARPPAWDMPARLAIAAGYVVLQTSIAGWLGPQLSGLLTPFPIVVSLLTAFAHHQQGTAAATRVLRGFLVGMYALASFFLVVALGIGPLGAPAAYLLGLVVCLALNGLVLWRLRARL